MIYDNVRFSCSFFDPGEGGARERRTRCHQTRSSSTVVWRVALHLEDDLDCSSDSFQLLRLLER